MLHLKQQSNCKHRLQPGVSPHRLANASRPPAGYESAAPRVLRVLERLVALRDITADYTYYGIASPWLQVRRPAGTEHLSAIELGSVQHEAQSSQTLNSNDLATSAPSHSQTKCLRLLQTLPPPDAGATQKLLHDVLTAIFNSEPHRVTKCRRSGCWGSLQFQQPALALAAQRF